MHLYLRVVTILQNTNVIIYISYLLQQQYEFKNESFIEIVRNWVEKNIHLGSFIKKKKDLNIFHSSSYWQEKS